MLNIGVFVQALPNSCRESGGGGQREREREGTNQHFLKAKDDDYIGNDGTSGCVCCMVLTVQQHFSASVTKLNSVEREKKLNIICRAHCKCRWLEVIRLLIIAFKPSDTDKDDAKIGC